MGTLSKLHFFGSGGQRIVPNLNVKFHVLLVTTVLLCDAGTRAAEPTFTNVTATVAPGLPELSEPMVAWGDFDNDGRLDFVLTGSEDGSQVSAISQVWRNTGSGFTNVTATVAPGLPGVCYSSVAWGDYDNDGRLDFLITGTGEHYVSQIWR